MAVEYNKQDYTTAKQILVFPDHYVAVAKTFLANDAAAVTENGRKIIKAGTIYPANTANAQGIVFNDLDITNGDRNGALIIHGFIKTAALPVTPTADAKAALKQIHFLPLYAITVTLTTTALAIDAGEASGWEHTVRVFIDGATFRPGASALAAWTIDGESTSKVKVESITVGPDGKYVDIHTKNSAAAAVGSTTVLPTAAITSTGDVPASATTIATVS